MGAWFFQSFGKKDTMIIEEIAKEHKVDVEVVAKHYKEMLDKIKKDEVKD